jgi:hypothetical protein
MWKWGLFRRGKNSGGKWDGFWGKKGTRSKKIPNFSTTEKFGINFFTNA